MSRYTEYKKRRLINFQLRIRELELENMNLKAGLVALRNENNELKSQIYYLESHKRS
jgi:hypothetical protein